MIRIGFDAKRIYNNFTGLGNYSRTMIDILSENFQDDEFVLYTPKIKQCEVTEKYLNKERCTTVMPKSKLLGSAWRTFGQVSDMKARGINVFHGLSHEIPMGLKKAGIPSVVTIHDLAFKSFTKMYHWQDRLIYDMKFKYACKNADRIIAISESTKRDIIRFYGIDEGKIDVVYQPVQGIYYKEVPVEFMKVVPERLKSLPSEFMLYVGSINSRKNLLSVVKAMEGMPKELQFPLVVVGNGREYKDEVMKYIADHGMESLIIFLGSTGGDELRWLYCKASIFVYPSWYEGFGLPVVEAMLCGCPVVTSNVSSLPEAAGPSSLKADPASIDDIRDCMMRALEDSDLRQKMIADGVRYAKETFAPDVLAKQVHDVLVNAALMQ